MSFVEGNLQLGIELAPGTLDRLKAQLATLEKGAALKVNIDPRPIQQGTQAIAALDQSVNRTANNISQRLGGAVKSTGLLLGAVGAAGAASLGAIAVKAILAGKEFNILQQQVRAGLTAILGTSVAAEGLLKNVNKLNDTSPFPRSTFLAATQQLVGFGVEAEKVVPILDAVQNAVAGIGGDSTDIARFSRAFAQIQSQGRLTGDVLFTLGEKGIDAAAIIGKAMGKTGQQIKSEVTAGTLGADKAIDALAKGLSEKFDGAVENVSQSFTGARDRINARLRDIGAEITKAFINPLGGGAAVDAMNNIAKGLGNIRDNFVKPLLPLFTALGKVVVDASQKFLDLTAKINPDKIQGFLGILQALVPLVGLFATKFAAGFIGQFAGAIPILGQFSSVLGGPIGAIAILIATVPQMRSAFLELVNALRPLVEALLPVFASALRTIQASFAVLAPILQVIISGISGLVSVITPLINILQKLGLAGPILLLLIARFTSLGQAATGALQSMTTGVGAFTTRLNGLRAGFAGNLEAIRQTNGGVTGLGDKFRAAGTSGKQALSGIGSSLAGLVSPVNLVIAGVAGLAEEIASANAKAKELAATFTEGLTIEKPDELKTALDRANQAIEEQEKLLKKEQTSVKGLAKSFFGFLPVVENDALSAGRALKAAREERDKLLGAGAIKKLIEDSVIAQTKELEVSQEDVIKRAEELGIVLTSIPGDRVTATIQKITKSFKEAATVPDGFSKFVDALRQQVDQLNKVRAASDKLKASQKALSDLQKTTSQQLQDNVTRAEGNLAEVRRNEVGVNDAVTRSELSLAQARRQTGQLVTKLNELEKERARLLADTGAEARELADANAALARTDQELLDISQRREAIERDQADLEEEKAGRIAAAGRSVERAQIALNSAKREELELKKELNKEDNISLDLTGLTTDQIKATLAGARAQAAAQRQVTKQKKSQEQINDEIRTAELNTLDATQANIDAKEAESDLIVDIGIQERENAEALLGLKLDEEASNRRRFEQQQAINLLNEGETTHKKTLKSLDEQIIGVQDDIITNAIDIRDREREVETALFNQSTYSITIRDAQRGVREAVEAIREHSDKIKEAQKTIAEDAVTYKEAVATARVDNEAINRILGERFGLNAKLLAQNPELLTSTLNKLLEGIKGAGGVKGFVGPLTEQGRRDILRGPLQNILLNHPDQLLKFLRENGFALAQGGIVNSETFARIGEAGREVVLPLTRPARMVDLLANSQVLHPVLNALGRIQLPSKKSSISRSSSIPSISSVSSPIPTLNRNGVSTKTVPFVSKNDGPATYGQIEELINVLRDQGGGLHVEAPITIEGTVDENELVRRINRGIDRTIREILSKRR